MHREPSENKVIKTKLVGFVLLAWRVTHSPFLAPEGGPEVFKFQFQLNNSTSMTMFREFWCAAVSGCHSTGARLADSSSRADDNSDDYAAATERHAISRWTTCIFTERENDKVSLQQQPCLLHFVLYCEHEHTDPFYLPTV